MTDTPKPLTSAELADLKAKAKAATPGPWQDKYGPEAPANFELSIIANVDGDADEHGRLKMDYTPICEVADHIDGPDNLAFILAANPETILRLIDMMERRDEQIEKLRSALERTEHNFRLAVAGKPVRDMQENLAENATALAATEPSDAKN